MNAVLKRFIVPAALVALVLSGGALVAQEHAPAQGPEAAASEETAQEDHAPAQGQADEHAEAEHAEEEHGGEHEGPTWTEYIQKWINFVLLIGLLYWLLVVPPGFVKENFEFDGLKVILAQRSETIIAANSLAKEQREEAQRLDAESSERLTKIEQEADDLVARAKVDAVEDRERIESTAVDEADRIRALARRDMNSEVERARRSLKTHVANLAVSIATELVRDNISDEDQDRMIRDYLERLGGSVA